MPAKTNRGLMSATIRRTRYATSALPAQDEEGGLIAFGERKKKCHTLRAARKARLSWFVACRVKITVEGYSATAAGPAACSIAQLVYRGGTWQRQQKVLCGKSGTGGETYPKGEEV